MFVIVSEEELEEYGNKIEEFQKKQARNRLKHNGLQHFKIQATENKKTKVEKITKIVSIFIKYTSEEIQQFSDDELEQKSLNTETPWIEYGVFFGRMGE